MADEVGSSRKESLFMAIESPQIHHRLKANRHIMKDPALSRRRCLQWGRFYFYELWESQAGLKQHAASSHYKHLELAVGGLLEEPFEVNILTEVLSTDESGSENSPKKTG